MWEAVDLMWPRLIMSGVHHVGDPICVSVCGYLQFLSAHGLSLFHLPLWRALLVSEFHVRIL